MFTPKSKKKFDKKSSLFYAVPNLPQAPVIKATLGSVILIGRVTHVFFDLRLKRVNMLTKKNFRNLLVIVLAFRWCFASPFLVDFPDKVVLTNEDYVDLQNKMKAIDFPSLINTYYPENDSRQFSERKYFERRMGIGINAILIDQEKGFFPQVIFEKIGRGGNCCVVSYASYNRYYPNLLKDLIPALKATGFNGYFYARIGGYPTPTGKEAKIRSDTLRI